MRLSNRNLFAYSHRKKGIVFAMRKAFQPWIGLFSLMTALCLSPVTGSAFSLSDDLYSFQVHVNGELIVLPCPYADMESNGWTYTGDGESLLWPDQHTASSGWKKGGVSLSADMVNTSWNVQPIKDCALGALTLDLSSANSEVLLPGGVQLGVSRTEDVKNAYGAPTSADERPDVIRYLYQLDYNQEAAFLFDAATGVLGKITLRNIVTQQAPDPSLVPAEVSPAISGYRSPAGLGNDLLTFSVEYGGALYQLPAPLTEFLKNGWDLPQKDDLIVKAYGSQQVTLSLGGEELSTWAYNPSDKAAFVSNCLITSISAGEGRADIPIALPGGARIGAREEDVLLAYDGISRKDKAAPPYHRYTFGDSSASVTLSVDIDTGLVSRIEVVHMP